MQLFDDFQLHADPEFDLSDYLFAMPQNMRQLRRIGILTEQSFSLKQLAESAEIIQYFKLGCNYITDQSPADELRFDFVELNKIKSKRNNTITYEQAEQATELINNSNLIVAGYLGHISSRYQLFLEKTLLALPHPVVITRDLVALYKFNPELANNLSHYFVVTPDSLVRLGNLLYIPMRPVRLPSNNWHNLCQLSIYLKRPTVCIASEQIIVCDPVPKKLSIFRLPSANSHYYLYLGLLSCLITVHGPTDLPTDRHMQAAAMILQSISQPKAKSIIDFLKNK